MSVGTTASANDFVVMELFTTRACGNCPPVDARVKKIVDESDDTLIALACHINYLNRKDLPNIPKPPPEIPDFSDPLSHQFCDTRQKDYRKANVLQRIYTPQIVINGVFDTVGSAEKTVTSGLKMAQQHEPLETITLSLDNDVLDISLPEMNIETPLKVWLFAYNEHKSIEGAAGLEDGEIIEYVNYVLHLENLMTWDGKSVSMNVPVTEIPADGYAVIAQYDERRSKKIVAAGKIERF